MAEHAKQVSELTNIIVGQLYSLICIVKQIDREGDEAGKKPIIVTLQFEESRRLIKMSSWDWSALNVFKSAIENRNICNITFKARPYKDTMAYNIQSIEVTDKITSIPEDIPYEETEECKNIKSWIPMIIEDYVKSDAYKTILNSLVVNNPNFYKWPAAKSLHHAFTGGLALHSYMVCNNALQLAQTYNGIRNMQIDTSLLVTGALLHDIGKLIEYEDSGEISLYGNFMSHMVTGIELVNDVCDANNIDKYSEEILKLKHIIVSHHGFLEFGSPNEPAIPEAFIVATADKTDAEYQAMAESLENTPSGRSTGKIRCLDDRRVIKMYEDLSEENV